LKRLCPLLAFAVVALLFAPGPAFGGYVTGVGNARTAHLSDDPNAVDATVIVPEVILGSEGYTYHFTLSGSNTTATRDYRLEVVVSPGDPIVEARFNATGPGPQGAALTTIDVKVGPDVLKFTTTNTPFAVELRSSNGSLIDSTSFSVDLRYKTPPPDGGLLALALASACLWGLVFLYTLHLHSTQRKLRARADALEHAHHEDSAGDRADGEKR
jgi:hypothetical protein